MTTYHSPVSEFPLSVPGRVLRNAWRNRLRPRARADRSTARVVVLFLLLPSSSSPSAVVPSADAYSQSQPCRGKALLSCYHAPGAQFGFLGPVSILSLLTEYQSAHDA